MKLFPFKCHSFIGSVAEPITNYLINVKPFLYYFIISKKGIISPNPYLACETVSN